MLPGVGGRCSHCRTVIKTKQQNGTLFSKRIYACHLAPLSVRNKIWSECAALHQSVPRPYDPSAALETASFSTATRAVDASTFVGSTVAVSAAAPVIRSSGLKPSTGPMHHFLDRVTAEQASAIDLAILNFLFPNEFRSSRRRVRHFSPCLRRCVPPTSSESSSPTARKLPGLPSVPCTPKSWSSCSACWRHGAFGARQSSS